MPKSILSENLCDSNILASKLNTVDLPNPAIGKAKVLNQIQQAYQNGIEYYQEGNYELAEQEFAQVLRPVLSKSPMKSIYINIDDCNKEELLSAMYHIGQIYLVSNQHFNNHAKAAAIFQYCDGFARKYSIEQFKVNEKEIDFLDEAHLVQEKLLESIGKADVNTNIEEKLNHYKQEIEDYKGNLAHIRKEAEEQVTAIRDWSIEETATRAKVVEEIYNDCSNFFVNNNADKTQSPGLVQRMLVSCFEQLGNPPEGCEYSVIGFGSLAGGRMTPWSDLEFAILINEDKPEFKEYFRNLTKLLHIKIVNVGETPLRSMGVEALNNFKIGNEENEWFWDDITKNGFSFDGSHWHACKLPLGRQGGYKVKKKISIDNNSTEEEIIYKPDFELILTPRQLSEFQLDKSLNSNDNYQEQKSWYQSDMHLVQSMRLVSLIYGSQVLIDEYRENIHTVETTGIVQKRTIEKLKEDIESFSLKLGDEEEGKLIDVKKDIFRIGDRIIDDLANYYGITAEKGQSGLTAWQAIDKMAKAEILSKEGAKHLKEALSISTELRLATYCHNQGQNETMTTFQHAVEHLNEIERKKLIEETFYIEDTRILHHFYYIMMKMQVLVQGFCNQGHHHIAKFILKFDPLCDDSYYNKGLVHARFLKYDDALKYMKAAEEDDPNDLDLLNSLFFLYRKTSKIEEAIILTNKILNIFKSNYRDELSCPHIAKIFNNLGEGYRNKGEYEEAIKYYKQALEIQQKAYEHSPLHPDFAVIYNNLGATYGKKGECEEAISYHKLALKIREKAYKDSPNHPDVATSYNNLGIEYSAKGEYEEAVKYHEQALEIYFKVYKHSPNHPDIADSYNNLGAVYSAKGEYEEAIKHYNLALELGGSKWLD